LAGCEIDQSALGGWALARSLLMLFPVASGSKDELLMNRCSPRINSSQHAAIIWIVLSSSSPVSSSPGSQRRSVRSVRRCGKLAVLDLAVVVLQLAVLGLAR
jgi:hypothetical protein